MRILLHALFIRTGALRLFPGGILLAGLGLAWSGGCTGSPGGGPDQGNANVSQNTNENLNENHNGGGNDNTVGNQNANDNAAPTGAVIVDHSAPTDFDSLPAATLEAVQRGYRIFYGHTSHGSQIITGMQMLQAEDGRCGFNAGEGTIQIHENDSVDLGYEGDLGWVDITREVLDTWDVDINMVMWSWCAGVSDNTEGGIDTYLAAMDRLEQDYPGVVFVYMTGHLDGTGTGGNLYARNNQIRDYCRTHNKVLFDFADLESYDPDGTYYPDDSDYCQWCVDWCAAHTCPAGCDDAAEQCAHSRCFNCYQKGRAFWCMMARIAGWSGP